MQRCGQEQNMTRNDLEDEEPSSFNLRRRKRKEIDMAELKLEIEELEYDEELANQNEDVFEAPDPLDGIGEEIEIDESEVEW